MPILKFNFSSEMFISKSWKGKPQIRKKFLQIIYLTNSCYPQFIKRPLKMQQENKKSSKKWAESMNKHFTIADKRMTQKHKKKFNISSH